jgi:hypothetical protein
VSLQDDRTILVSAGSALSGKSPPRLDRERLDVGDRRTERGLHCARVSMRLREQVAALRSRDSDRTGRVPNEQSQRPPRLARPQ